MTYLDNSTSTQLSPKALEAMIPLWRDQWGSTEAPHQKGQELLSYLEKAYQRIYALLGADSQDEFVFTSSGAEAVCHVIESVYRDVTKTTGKNHFVAGRCDEAAAILAITRLESSGCVGKMAEVSNLGVTTVDAIADAISPRTALVSLSVANGLTGVIQPVAEIAKLCRERGILIHLEVSHVLGKAYFELEELNPDFVSFAGDLIHGPAGTGGLLIRKGRSLSPFIVGSSEQGGLRAGAFSVPGLVGLSVAAEEALENRDLVATEVARLRDAFETGVMNQTDGRVLFSESERLPHVSSMAFPGVHAEALLHALSRQGIYGSIGGGSFQKAFLIGKACGLSDEDAHTMISFSFSVNTTEQEVAKAIQAVGQAVSRLNQLTAHLGGGDGY